ncbi:MAG: phosphate ABC transporter permease subunit PstC [Sphingomonadaceae bacterium]|nr:MAG: phosphate ABC transporter permease subunit PstC [Sphingomonadaceae bacterium]
MRTRQTSPHEKRVDRALALSTRVAAGLVWLLLAAIVAALVYYALPAMQQFGFGFVTSTTWNPASGREQYGILPMMYGTFISSFIALLFAVPLGLGAAIFLNEDFLPVRLRGVLIFLVELLAAIPSVIYGLWGIFVVIPLMEPMGDWLHANLGWIPLFGSPSIGPGILPASIVLAIMILPITTSLSQSSLLALPSNLRAGALGLGATRWTTIFRVLIPAAFSGIAGGVLLALGRALGETMAVTMLIGNSNQLSFSLLAPGNTIASLLANQFAEAKDLQVSALIYAALVLVMMTFVVNALGFRIVESVRRKNR